MPLNKETKPILLQYLEPFDCVETNESRLV